MRQFLKNFLFIFLTLFLIAGILGMLRSTPSSRPEIIGVGQAVEQINRGEVKRVIIEGDTLKVERKDSALRPQEVKKEPQESFGDIIKNYGISDQARRGLEVIVKDESAWKFWASNLIPALLPLILIMVFFYFMSRGVQGMNQRALGFGAASPRQVKPEDKDRKTFLDVAGAREAKEELKEVVEFLKDQPKFVAMGAKIPKGVLLMGAPGTGKTLLARAVAGEANVPFFHMSGSEFVEMFVGVGASRVRDLFAKAKKAAPAIVFIDEIDAVGRRRGAGLGGGHDEREQTLNQILVEMDGFDPNSGVIVVAATNRPDVLDPALLRPGRFDRRIVIDMPDIKDREEILAVHARGKAIAPEVNLRAVAERTPGFSGADLANLLNEAAILAVQRGQTAVSLGEIFPSIEKVLLGPERKSRIISEHEKKVTAYHEAGHAVAGYFLPHSDPVRKVSIISRGTAGGYTLKMPSEDKHYHTLAQFKDELAMALGGYVVEKMVFGSELVSTGPASDLRNATKLARDMVTRYGMSSALGPRTFGEHEELIFLGREIHEERDYSDKTAEAIDTEIKRLIAEAEARAHEVITKHRSELEALVAALLERETIEQEEIEAIMGVAQVKASGEELGDVAGGRA